MTFCVSGEDDIHNGLVCGLNLLRDPAEFGAFIHADGIIAAGL